MSDCTPLAQLIAVMPKRGEHEDAPPYMHTLALLESLRMLGFPCELWNAVMESRWKITVVAGIRTQNEILDWDGADPRQYPEIYANLQGAVIVREGGSDIIPGKREQALKLHPEIQDQSRRALEYVRLQVCTPNKQEDGDTRRL